MMKIDTMMAALTDAYEKKAQELMKCQQELKLCQEKIKELTSTADEEAAEETS